MRTRLVQVQVDVRVHMWLGPLDLMDNSVGQLDRCHLTAAQRVASVEDGKVDE